MLGWRVPSTRVVMLSAWRQCARASAQRACRARSSANVKRASLAAEDEADAAEVREGRGTLEAVARVRLLEEVQSLAERSLGLGVPAHRLVDDAERAERGRHA